MRITGWLLFAPLVMGGCTVNTTPAPPPPGPSDGTLTVDWSIDGSKDSNLCFQAAADTIEIVVYAEGSSNGVAFDDTCDAFASDIALAPGNYSASAVLLDSSGTPRTTTLDIAPFTIFGNDDLVIPIDFPADAFL